MTFVKLHRRYYNCKADNHVKPIITRRLWPLDLTFQPFAESSLWLIQCNSVEVDRMIKVTRELSTFVTTHLRRFTYGIKLCATKVDYRWGISIEIKTRIRTKYFALSLYVQRPPFCFSTMGRKLEVYRHFLLPTQKRMMQECATVYHRRLACWWASRSHNLALAP